ncbi:hypothetical protein CW706_03155 [Candidatus Bathyarchaeota archaeon]|nr:MAG: hypothetical protein CW706_03155 [Candidatus Bathyarchaeota archaeon]
MRRVSRRSIHVTVVGDEICICGLPLGDLLGMLESLEDVDVEIQVIPCSEASFNFSSRIYYLLVN